MWRIWRACSCKGWSWWGQHSPKCCHSAIRHWTLFQQPSRWQSVAQRLRGSGSLGRGGKTVQLACLHHQCPTKSWAHHWLLLPTLALFSARFPDHLANAFPSHSPPTGCQTGVATSSSSAGRPKASEDLGGGWHLWGEGASTMLFLEASSHCKAAGYLLAC